MRNLQSGPLTNKDKEDYLKKCTVAIRETQKGASGTIGTGVIVTDDGLILTCYHVIGDIRNGIPYYKAVDVHFAEANISKLAEVAEEYCEPSLDIAFLRLQDNKLPENSAVAYLSEKVYTEHEFKSFGFRKPKQFAGLFSNLEIHGRTREVSINTAFSLDVLQLYSDEIEPGMSGSAVLDMETDRVVGIIFQHNDTRGTVDTNLNFAIPVQSFIKVHPELKENNLGLRKDRQLAENNVESVYRRQYHSFLSCADLNDNNKTIANTLYRWLRDAVRSHSEERIYYHKPELAMQKSKVLTDWIPKCRSMIILITRDSVNTGWVREEYYAAKYHNELFEDFKIIPVCIEKCDIPQFINRDTVIELSEGRLDLKTSKNILQRIYYDQRTGPGLAQTRDLYISCGWKEGEKPFAEYICSKLDEKGFRLIGEAEDRSSESFDENRIESIISTCGGFVAIVPYRPNHEFKTSKYIIDEITIAKTKVPKIPRLIIYDPNVHHFLEEKGLTDQSLSLTKEPLKESDEEKTLNNQIERISKEWEKPRNEHYIFFATDPDDNNEERIEAVKDHIQLITSLTCEVSPDYKDNRHEIISKILHAYLVIADISDNNQFSMIQAGIALGAAKDLQLIAQGYSDGKINAQSLLKNIQGYADDTQLLQKVHRIAYKFRRRIVNYELPSRILGRV